MAKIEASRWRPDRDHNVGRRVVEPGAQILDKGVLVLVVGCVSEVEIGFDECDRFDRRRASSVRNTDAIVSYGAKSRPKEWTISTRFGPEASALGAERKGNKSRQLRPRIRGIRDMFSNVPDEFSEVSASQPRR